MPTIIDSLVVRLGLDSKDFKKGTQEVDGGLKQITKSATAFLAVLGGSAAMKQFIEHQVEANSALDRFSRNLGEAISTVSAWSQAAEVAGGSAAGLQGTMDMLSKSQTELQLTGNTAVLPYFARMGIALADMRGQARPTSEMLLELADRFGNMPRTTANNMGRMMGIDQGTMQLLLKGRGEVELMLKRQKEFNAVSKQQGEEASRLSKAFTESKQSFNAFGRELLSRATPAIEMLFAVMEKLGNWMRENREFVEKFLTIMAVGLGAIGAALIPINLTATAVLALAAAIALLWQDYETFKRGGETLIDWKKWGPGIDAAREGLGAIRDTLENIIYRAIAAADILGGLADKDWARVKHAAEEFISTEDVAARRRQGESAAPGSTPSTSGASGDDRSRFVAVAASQLGVPPAVIDAHLRSETGKFGLSTIGQYNYGNIKSGGSWTGKTSGQNVLEYDKAGNPLKERASFRAYSTPEEAAADYARLIGKRYPGAAGATDAESYATALKRGGYATDPDYVSKMAKVARGIPGASAAASGAGAAASAPTAGNTTTVTTHVGEVKIYSAATDAAGVAQDLTAELERLTVQQANSGLF